MAKGKNIAGTKRTIKEKKSSFNLDNLIPPKFQVAAAIALIIILFLLYFSPIYFGGKTFYSGDIVASKSMETYLHSDTEGYTLWNPYVFCGMPAYALATSFKWFNLIEVGMYSAVQFFSAFFAVEYANWTLRLIIMAITAFFLSRYFTKNIYINLFAAIATAFSTGIIVFLYIGHVTKLTSLCWYPLIFLILLRFQEKIRLLDIAILIIALQLFVQGWHVQIIFYTLFAIGIYFLYYFISALKRKDYPFAKQLLKSAGMFTVAAVAALLIQLDNFSQIYEYSPYSTRGTVSIMERHTETDESTSSQFYQYATDWSFSPGEVMTFIIPSFYGFGNSTYNGPLTNNQPQEVNTYFGQMRFVDVPMYMGVIVFILALFSIYLNWDMRYVRYLTILLAIALTISFGRNFPVLYDLMFNYFPFFNRFRVPSMILVLVQINLPILAAIGLHKIVSLRNTSDNRYNKVIRNVMFVFAGLFAITLVAQGGISDWFTSRVQETGEKGQQLQPLYQYMSDMFIADALLGFFMLASIFGVMYLFITDKANVALFMLVVLAATTFDLFRIDGRAAKYIEDQNVDQYFNEPGYVKAIKSQNDKEPFRILNLGTLSQPSNYHAYFLMQDISGYSGIKPRAYQDIIDVVGSPANPTLWRMLNVKYLINDKEINYPGFTPIMNAQNSFVYRYEQALPRAYFVDSVAVQKPLDILNAIKNNSFDPQKVAYLEEGSVSVNKPDSSASVKVSSYTDERITIDAAASGNNFLFLGDTYIPVGWKALIDGNETTIHKVNHNFRGIVVPAGKHKIEFVYAPASFTISKYVALSLSSLTILLLFVGIYQNTRKKPEEKE